MTLVNSAIDTLPIGGLINVPQLQVITDAANAALSGAANGNGPTLAQLNALGITGVTEANLAAVLTAIHNTPDDGSAVDTQGELQAIVINVVTAINTISVAAQENNANSLTEVIYALAGVTGVTESNLYAINSALNSDTVDGQSTNTPTNIQYVVNAYNALLFGADGVSNHNVASTPTQYAAIGVTGINSISANLLDSVIDTLTPFAINTTGQIQVLADAANAIISGAAGNTSPTVEQFNALGITGVNLTNLATIQSAIAATADNGSGVDSQAKLQALVDHSPLLINSITIDGIPTGLQNLYIAGDSIFIKVTLNAAGIVQNTPGLLLNVGGTIVQADYVSGSGSSDIIFSYTLPPGLMDSNGISIDANSITQISGSLRNIWGDNSNFVSDPLQDNEAFRVDSSAPTVLSTEINGATSSCLTVGGIVHITLTMSEAVSVTGSPLETIIVGPNTVNASYNASLSDSTHLTFDYTIQAGENDLNGISISVNGLHNGSGISDVAGNLALLAHAAVPDNSSYLVDTLSPIFINSNSAIVHDTGLGITSADIIYTASVNDATPVVFSLSGNGVDNSLFSINSVTGELHFRNTESYISPNDSNADHRYNITLQATDEAGNHTERAITVTLDGYSRLQPAMGVYFDAAHTMSAGNLIAPVESNGGHVYYYWDVSGDGESGSEDLVSHDYLDNIFKYGSDFSTLNPNGPNADTSTNYRYATLYTGDGVAVHVTLPTIGGELGANRAGTEVEGNAINHVFNDLLAVWDSSNGSGTDTGLYGIPNGWASDEFYSWSSTQTSTENHASILFGTGFAHSSNDTNIAYAALEVIYQVDLNTPVFSSSNDVSVHDTGHGVDPTVVVYDANVNAPRPITFSLAGDGVDNSLFTINAATGEMHFRTTETYINPNDYGTDHTYNVTIQASDNIGNHSEQAVNITLDGYTRFQPSISVFFDEAHTLSAGNLIAPLRADGDHAFYYWDISGDGASGENDLVDHNYIDSIFKYGSDFTTLNPNGTNVDTNDVYRYATLYTDTGIGVRVALPTVGGPLGANRAGTAVDNAVVNAEFDDLLAIWDASNGQSTQTGLNGVPSGWAGDEFYSWSATSTGSNAHASLLFSTGFAHSSIDSNTAYVALEIL
ncbi:beta strand repeat-containing protein [Janthinobacterium sp. Ant5-2-1]|uniref:beta strand repeat-containing protein n=1 Tax=Janthinobacterium sp. Ant5-2-1 TaxID=1755239 RepID=UPI001F1E8FAC|nr:cadherin repeat domain-containing protein [Janthinobacterium sp. Ant5-2-1]